MGFRLYIVMAHVCLAIGGCQMKAGKLAIPKVVLCVPQAAWPGVISEMRSFGQAEGLKFLGGTEMIGTADKDRPMLNVSLAQGYNYYNGDALDLWITSRPFDPGLIDLAAIIQSPPTPKQLMISKAFVASFAKFGPPAKTVGDRAVCQ